MTKMTRSMPRFALAHLSDEAVAAYADGVLSAGPQSRADHHLFECAECAAAVREQRQARSALRSAAAPTVPGSLLERLRQLPASAPFGNSAIPAALSMDGRPVFAAFDSRGRGGDFHFAAPADVLDPQASFEPIGRFEPIEPFESISLPTARIGGATPHRRRVMPGLGLSAVAAATLIVGVMATTAMTEGGAGATVAHPVVNSPVRSPNVQLVSHTTPILNLVAPR